MSGEDTDAPSAAESAASGNAAAEDSASGNTVAKNTAPGNAVSGKTAAEAGRLWQRWTGESGPFYRSCAVLGFDPISDSSLAGSGAEKPPLEFCTGAVRLGLRNIPAVILVAATLSFVLEQLNDFYLPLGSHLPLDLVSLSIQPGALLALPVVIVWGALLARIFRGSVSTDALRIHRSIVFYGTLSVLLAGVAFSIYLVAKSELTGTRQHLAFRSGYFLFLFLEGHLAYDGLALRGENLFWNLRDSEIVDETQYAAFRDQLSEALAPLELGPYSIWPGDNTGSIGPVGISPGLLFAMILLAPITPLPLLAFESGHPLLGATAYGITVLMQVFLVAVLFQFVVMIWEFSKLLSGDYLDYKPFHPDEHGGYRALGLFATRVNVMLAVAGGYVAFRFLTGGIRQFHALGDGSVLDLLTWGVSFLAPFVVYFAVVILWLYFSFWRMHRRMKRGRREKIKKIQERTRSAAEDDVEAGHRRMEDPEFDAPAWESLRNAPVWPIRRRSLLGIAALDAVPVLVTLFL